MNQEEPKEPKPKLLFFKRKRTTMMERSVQLQGSHKRTVFTRQKAAEDVHAARTKNMRTIFINSEKNGKKRTESREESS